MRSPAPPIERMIRVDGARLLVRQWGSIGPAALFWHALGDHTSLQMVEAGPILNERFGLRIVGVDAPGFGASPALPYERYAMPSLASLAIGVVDELQLPRPAWIGASWGGVLGVHVAAEHSNRLGALVLVDGGYFDEGFDLPAETLEGLQAHFREQPGFRYPNLAAVFEEWRGVIGRWSPALESYARSGVRADGAEIVSIAGPDLFAAALFHMITAPLAEAQARLGKSNLPVLLLAATEPPDMEPERADAIGRFRERVPAAEIRRVATRHLMLESAPEEVAGIIGPWLSSQLDGEP